MLEDIVKQLRAILQNQLPAKLDQIELERADSVTLEDIQSFLVQESYKETHLKYPSIAVVGLGTTATNVLSRRRELRHEVSLWVADRMVAPDSELPQTRLWRYVEAMERILASDPTFGGKAVDSVITSHRYLSPRKGKEGEEFVKRAFLILEVLERPSVNNY